MTTKIVVTIIKNHKFAHFLLFFLNHSILSLLTHYSFIAIPAAYAITFSSVASFLSISQTNSPDFITIILSLIPNTSIKSDEITITATPLLARFLRC